MDISKLTDKNEMAAYEYCKQVVVESAQSDEHFKDIDGLSSLLTDKNSYVRTRGFGLICCQARWDKRRKSQISLGKDDSAFE